MGEFECYEVSLDRKCSSDTSIWYCRVNDLVAGCTQRVVTVLVNSQQEMPLPVTVRLLVGLGS